MLKATLLIFMSLDFMVSLTLASFSTSKAYNSQLKFPPKSNSTRMFTTSSAVQCAALCLNKQQDCFGFRYNGSICAIVTSYLKEQPFNNGSGKEYFTEICPAIDLICLHGGTINMTYSSPCGEASCVCVPGANNVVYRGRQCERVCIYKSYAGKDLPSVDIRIDTEISDYKVCFPRCAALAKCESFMYGKAEKRCIFKHQSPLTNPEKPLDNTDATNVLYALNCTL